MDFNEDEFKNFISNLANGFDKEYLESPILKHIISNAKYLDDLDNIHTMIIFPFERCLSLAIKQTRNMKDEIITLWMDYSFLENNISELCSQLYGHGCSVDRGRYIVKSFIKFKETGVMPIMDWEQQYTFHYPKTGSLEQWFALVEGVHRLKYGYNKEYLIALREIMKTKFEQNTENA